MFMEYQSLFNEYWGLEIHYNSIIKLLISERINVLLSIEEAIYNNFIIQLVDDWKLKNCLLYRCNEV